MSEEGFSKQEVDTVRVPALQLSSSALTSPEPKRRTLDDMRRLSEEIKRKRAEQQRK